jgi:hypothetical protein
MEANCRELLENLVKSLEDIATWESLQKGWSS